MKIHFLVYLITVALGCGGLFSQEKSESVPDRKDQFPSYYPFLFQAVVEGCFRDGLDETDIDCIIPPIDEEGQVFRDQFANFVYNCGVCSACYDRFVLYSYRQRLTYQKSTSYCAKLWPRSRVIVIRLLYELWAG